MKLTVERDTLGPVLMQYLARGKDPRRALEPMGVALVSLAKRAHSDASLRPHVWPALKGGGASTLQRTTMMRRAWVVGAVSATSVTVENATPYAGAHYDGASSGPFIIRAKNGKGLKFTIGGRVIIRRSVKHPGVKVPKRRALPVMDDGRLTPHAFGVVMGIALQRMVK